MAVAWLLFPLMLLAVCLGCGLAVERAAGWQLAGPLLPSLGLSLVIVASALTTEHNATARLTTPLVVVLALVGYAVSWKRVRLLRPDYWALAVGLGVFAVCAAPMVLSGNASFLGYFVLNDAAVHFSLINQLLSHGHSLGSLPLSSYSETVRVYMSSSYPTGADVAVGAVRPLVGQDIAWIFQPYLAVIVALGAVTVHELLDGVVRSQPLRAACAFISAQAGLLYAFYLEASIKEVAATWLITLTVVLVFATLRRRLTLRGFVPVLVATVAGLDVIDLAVAPWIGLPLAVLVVASAWRSRGTLRRLRAISRRRMALAIGSAVVVVAVLAAPIVGKVSTFVSVAKAVLTNNAGLGNLIAPLPRWEMVGIWPAGDFRLVPLAHIRGTYALIGVAIASGVLGTIWLIRTRAFPPLVLIVGNGLAAAYLLSLGSPYASAKVMMIFSLTAILAAMLGSVALHQSGRRIEGWLLAAVIAGGVLWTNALAYHDASVAPRARFAELAAIGSRFSGQGPAFYNLQDEFAAYFLRDVAPIDPALEAQPVPRPGLPPRTPAQGRTPWDPDDLDPAYAQTFKLMVLGRSPRVSRPPANFRLVYQGKYYDVWQRTAAPRVLTHISLGTSLYPGSIPSCKLVHATAAKAVREHARLAYVERPRVPTLVPTQATRPADWGLVSGDPYSLIPRQQAGAVTGTVPITQGGRYQVWLQASLAQPFRVIVNGRQVGKLGYELGPPGQFVPLGEVSLGPGRATIQIIRPGHDLRPGNGGTGLLGPLMLVPAGPPPAVSQIAPQQARTLCGQTLDWLEIVR